MNEKNKSIVELNSQEERYNITREKVIDMLLRDREFAYQNNKIESAINVSKLLGDSIGMFKSKEDQSGSVLNIKSSFTQEDKKSLEALGFDFAKIKIDPDNM